MADNQRREPPAFGEYAPEGWEWKPEGESPDASPAAAGQLNGVPHNLGAPSQSGAPAQQPDPSPTATPDRGAANPARPSDPAPYRAAAAPVNAPTAAAGSPRTGDRVITIVLLSLGVFGALYLATSMYQLPTSLAQVATALEIDGFTVPASVSTLASVGAIIVFAVYALNVVFSIQRLRRRKLTFWVPLVAAVVAFVVVFIMMAVAFNQTPEVVAAMSDPDALTKLLDYAANLSTP